MHYAHEIYTEDKYTQIYREDLHIQAFKYALLVRMGKLNKVELRYQSSQQEILVLVKVSWTKKYCLHKSLKSL